MVNWKKLNEDKLTQESHVLFRNRDRLEIIAELLDNVRNDSPKMHIIYGARLSHKLGSTYIDHLVREKLLESVPLDEGRKAYRLSQRGLRFLELYESLQEITFGNLNRILVREDSMVQPVFPLERINDSY
jgi:predicted transcriptional regulator